MGRGAGAPHARGDVGRARLGGAAVGERGPGARGERRRPSRLPRRPAQASPPGGHREGGAAGARAGRRQGGVPTRPARASTAPPSCRGPSPRDGATPCARRVGSPPQPKTPTSYRQTASPPPAHQPAAGPEAGGPRVAHCPAASSSGRLLTRCAADRASYVPRVCGTWNRVCVQRCQVKVRGGNVRCPWPVTRTGWWRRGEGRSRGGAAPAVVAAPPPCRRPLAASTWPLASPPTAGEPSPPVHPHPPCGGPAFPRSPTHFARLGREGCS